MDQIIELYIEEGFYLPIGITIERFGRMRDQIYVILLFYMLLIEKRMKTNQPDSKYMHQEFYYFIKNPHSSLTHWIKIYFITINIAGIFLFISMAMFLFEKYA